MLNKSVRAEPVQAQPPSNQTDQSHPAANPLPRGALASWMWAHPARALALGLGSGLSRRAPGTVGTAWAWLIYLLLANWMAESLPTDAHMAAGLGLAVLVACWASSVCASHMQQLDPGVIVIDEIVAFWWVLWFISPCSWSQQFLAFVLFRFFDAVKPGPVGWADTGFKRRAQAVHTPDAQRSIWIGVGIVADDLVAAALTLLCLALWRGGPVA